MNIESEQHGRAKETGIYQVLVRRLIRVSNFVNLFCGAKFSMEFFGDCERKNMHKTQKIMIILKPPRDWLE